MREKTGAVITELTAQLKKVFSADLLAVVLYGSAARKGYNADVSDINVLIILENGRVEKITEFASAAKTLIRGSRISPVIMTGEEFASAADVFPLEYGDILDAHSVVYGSKEILNIKENRENLRLQLEEKLRGAVADLRGMIIAAGGSEKLLMKFLLRWSSLGAVLFRGLLRLKGNNAAGMDAATVFAEVERSYGVSLEGFSVLNNLRQNRKSRVVSASAIAGMLIEPLVSLVRAVDAMGEKTA